MKLVVRPICRIHSPTHKDGDLTDSILCLIYIMHLAIKFIVSSYVDTLNGTHDWILQTIFWMLVLFTMVRAKLGKWSVCLFPDPR